MKLSERIVFQWENNALPERIKIIIWAVWFSVLLWLGLSWCDSSTWVIKDKESYERTYNLDFSKTVIWINLDKALNTKWKSNTNDILKILYEELNDKNPEVIDKVYKMIASSPENYDKIHERLKNEFINLNNVLDHYSSFSRLEKKSHNSLGVLPYRDFILNSNITMSLLKEKLWTSEINSNTNIEWNPFDNDFLNKLKKINVTLSNHLKWLEEIKKK